MMIKWLLRQSAKKFGARYNYDTSYMEEVIDASASAGVRLSAFPLISQYRGPKRGQEVWVGAMLASSLNGDCGPCAQLTLDMALEAGAPEDELRECLQGDAEHAGDIGLGFRFARAAIAGDSEADKLGVEIKLKYGQQAVVAAAFAAASGRMYPILKRGLGHGATCQKLRIGI